MFHVSSIRASCRALLTSECTQSPAALTTPSAPLLVQAPPHSPQRPLPALCVPSLDTLDAFIQFPLPHPHPQPLLSKNC